MSLRKDGSYRCDRDGEPLENGGVHECSILSDLDDAGRVIVYHFCRKNGCDRKVASKRNLADYLQGQP